MAKYRVAFASSAKQELKKLPAQLVRGSFPVWKTASNPRPSGCKKLMGGDREWRIRVGDYRVVYTIDDAELLVEVTRIRHPKRGIQAMSAVPGFRTKCCCSTFA